MLFESRIKTTIILGAHLALFLAVAGSAHATDIRVEETMVEMADGVGLSTRVYLPERADKYPTVLLRTSYGSENMGWVAEYLASHEYAVVVQDVRGTTGSGGGFSPFVNEKADGVATLDWLLGQSFCNGDVGLWGVSYLGFAANEMASTGHPAVKAVFNMSGWSDLAPFFGHGGCFHLMAHLPWFVTFAGGQNLPAEAWPQIFRARPISQFFQGADGTVKEMIEEPYDYSNFTMPILHVTGWYDYIYPNTLRTYDSILTRVPDAAEQRLIIGVWPHNNAMNGQSVAGDEDFGPTASWGIEAVNEISRRWFDLHLKGKDDGLGREPLVKLFVMGSNEWRGYDAWPPKAVNAQVWYVDCIDRANGSAGTGTLAAQMTDKTTSDQFVFDPNDPVPTTGGANSHFFQDNLGILDQSEVARRPDVLVYTSEPLASELTLVGPVRATIYAATEGKDTDFTAKLVEVRADGYERNIVDGIARASYVLGLDSAVGLESGKVYKYEIDMGATAIRLEPGSRLRLEISSSNFPKYDRNPNNGVEPLDATEFLPVNQIVYHTEEYPTQVLLPVLEDTTGNALSPSASRPEGK